MGEGLRGGCAALVVRDGKVKGFRSVGGGLERRGADPVVFF